METRVHSGDECFSKGNESLLLLWTASDSSLPDSLFTLLLSHSLDTPTDEMRSVHEKGTAVHRVDWEEWRGRESNHRAIEWGISGGRDLEPGSGSVQISSKADQNKKLSMPPLERLLSHQLTDSRHPALPVGTRTASKRGKQQQQQKH